MKLWPREVQRLPEATQQSLASRIPKGFNTGLSLPCLLSQGLLWFSPFPVPSPKATCAWWLLSSWNPRNRPGTCPANLGVPWASFPSSTLSYWILSPFRHSQSRPKWWLNWQMRRWDSNTNTRECKGFFLPLNPGDFCSEYWLFPPVPQYDISKFLTNSLCLKQVQIAAHTAWLAADKWPGSWPWNLTAWVQIPTLPLPSCAARTKLLHQTVTQFPYEKWD